MFDVKISFIITFLHSDSRSLRGHSRATTTGIEEVKMWFEGSLDETKADMMQ